MLNNITSPMFEKINAAIGIVVAALSYVFGEHWILFAAYLLLNIADFITGCIKARLNKASSSVKGISGVVKKFGYWVMICVAFGMSAIFIEVGKTIGVDLTMTSMIGWYVLGTLIINELRSIIENFVESGLNVPSFLTKGLEVASKVVETKTDDSEE